jgi:hypothetical protein
MTDPTFWRVIEESLSRAPCGRHSAADPESALEGRLWLAQSHELLVLLNDLDLDEVIQFDHTFDRLWAEANSHEIWGAGFIICGGCSDDGFMDFRTWLISKGEKVYKTAMVNPDSLSEIDTTKEGRCQFESFRYLAPNLWCRKTGRPLDEFPRRRVLNGGPSGKPWQEAELPFLYPRLWKQMIDRREAWAGTAAGSATLSARAASEVGHAFKHGAYQKVVDLLNPYRESLSPSQRKRYQIALSRISENTQE